MKRVNEGRIYCILNTITGKRYVGGTSRGLPYRKIQHLYELRNGKHTSGLMQAEYKEYGEQSLVFFILEKLDTIDPKVICAREQHWIDFYSPEYNTTPAGSHIPPSARTSEAIEKANDKRRGRKQSQDEKDRRAASIRQFWATHPPKAISQEQRKHLSEINTGKNSPNWGLKRSAEVRKKMGDAIAKPRTGFVSPEGVEYRGVMNLAEFCREHNLNYFGMAKLASGNVPHYKRWKRLEG